MHTITATAISPLVVAAARRVDANASVNSINAGDWLAQYWDAMTARAITASGRADALRYGDDAVSSTLGYLADALVNEDAHTAACWVSDWRQMADLQAGCGDLSLSEMIVSALLDWSKWCGDPRIDDARAQDWLRSLLT
jgi:hypothetical protein